MKRFLFLLLLIPYSANCEHSQLLVKFPTRERAHKFFDVLDLYYKKLSNTVTCHFVISCDIDDTGERGMNTPESITKLNKYPNLSYYFSEGVSKIEAVNRDIDKHSDFDVLLIASDDMMPVQNGYDKTIIDLMMVKFPDTDGTLNFNDGHIGDDLNTVPIMGKKYYSRFNYVYHPKYISICCDLEFTLVAKMTNKEACSDQVIIRHDHGAYGFEKDKLYYRNESKKFYQHDRDILQRRKSNNFDLTLDEILVEKHLSSSLDLFGYKGKTPIKWTILIATIDKRKDKFANLYRKLMDQIQTNHLEHKVEVFFFKDDQRHKVGYKRNTLLQNAKGEYVCFLDDDDDISDDYIPMLHKAMLSNPDSIKFVGIKYTPGEKPLNFVHSLKYHRAFVDKEGVACSPTYHVNPVRREIAVQAKFPEQNYNEDTTWARRLYDLKLLKNEYEIKTPYYFYHHDYSKSEAVPECAKKDRRIRWNPQGMLVLVDTKKRRGA